jgi:hypothetical protein
LAAKVIRLPLNIFLYRRASWNKYLADGILNHVILTRREKVRFALAFELSKGPSEEKVQYNKEPKNEDNSIHSGGLFLIPQSYGTA